MRAPKPSPSLLLALLLAGAAPLVTSAQAAATRPEPVRDVFVVGPDTAFGDPLRDFKPTRVELTNDAMDISGRRDLVRALLMEQGFAHRTLPLGAPGLTLRANGRLTVDGDQLKKTMYKKGTSVGAGDRIMITDIAVHPDSIDIDINGGPYLPHRFLRHFEVNGIALAGDGQVGELPTGTRITLLFEGGTPRLTGSEVKALLEPLLDFGLKTSEQAFADTLPDDIKKAVEEHEVLVGMNRRMVLAALGAPESKLRERAEASTTGEVFEEWIYGHTPQSIRFVRFRGDRVIQMKLAELGKPIQVFDKDQLANYRDPALDHVVPLGDTPIQTRDADPDSSKAPSLLGPLDNAPATKKPDPAARPKPPPPSNSVAQNLM